MITKEEYVLRRVKTLIAHYGREGDNINPSVLNELIAQWEFDYDMEKEYRPETLTK